MRIFLSYAMGAFLLSSWGCDPKKEPVTPQEQDFSCIKLFDEVGQTMGLHGSCTTSDDWGNIPLNAEENAFLNFSDTISLNSTVATSVSFIGIGPNPVKVGQAMGFYAVGATFNPYLKVKIAIVDQALHIVQQNAVRLQGTNSMHLFIDPAKFESGKYYRVYYRVSAEGAPSLLEGYGNILVCKTYIDGVNTTIESDCF